MAYLTFTDTTGDVVIECLSPRFRSYTIDVRPVGERVYSLGTGYGQETTVRNDHLVRVELDQMEADDLPLAIRCKVHLLTGGAVCLYTEDLDANVYECEIAPHETPEIRGPDPESLWFSLVLPLRHLPLAGGAAATATPAPAIYERDGRTRSAVSLSGCVWIT